MRFQGAQPWTSEAICHAKIFVLYTDLRPARDHKELISQFMHLPLPFDDEDPLQTTHACESW